MTADPVSPEPVSPEPVPREGLGDEGPGDEASLTYEQLVEALESLVERMADGHIGIEEAVDLYERAGRLHALAAERLARVQARIDRLAPPATDT